MKIFHRERGGGGGVGEDIVTPEPVSDRSSPRAAGSMHCHPHLLERGSSVLGLNPFPQTC